MNIPDRSRRDPDIAESLSILGAAGNAALIERNHRLAEENESLLDGAAKRQGYVEELEAIREALTTTVHTQSREMAALRLKLVQKDVEIAELRQRLSRAERPRPLDRIEVALGAATLVWDELRAPAHRGWALFALGMGGLFLAIVAMGGSW